MSIRQLPITQLKCTLELNVDFITNHDKSWYFNKKPKYYKQDLKILIL